ncbi:MAG: 2-amino-4-hydroxy-6-hydroxymethyldihydropteridine diphosphokinase [Cyclobacteriaceae bacterium]
MKGIFLLLGTNLGSKTENLQQALRLLQNGEVIVVDYSSVYQTKAWGNENQDDFLNMVIRVDSILSPIELLEHCQEVEKKMGRKRDEKWGSRIIDIDILYYDNIQSEETQLTIPHPGIALRRFTLTPLSEMIPSEMHPILNLTQKELLEICPDTLSCEKTEIYLEI